MSKPNDSDDDPIGREIFRYTRHNAIRDGYLLDITETARTHALLNLPTVITLGLWETLVGDERFTADHPAVRDVCDGVAFEVCGLAIGNDWSRDGKTLTFKFSRGFRRLTAKLVLGPGDGGLFVTTIMLPSED